MGLLPTICWLLTAYSFLFKETIKWWCKALGDKQRLLMETMLQLCYKIKNFPKTVWPLTNGDSSWRNCLTLEAFKTISIQPWLLPCLQYYSLFPILSPFQDLNIKSSNFLRTLPFSDLHSSTIFTKPLTHIFPLPPWFWTSFVCYWLSYKVFILKTVSTFCHYLLCSWELRNIWENGI